MAKAALPEAEIIVDAGRVSNDRLNEAALAVMASMQIRIINREARQI